MKYINNKSLILITILVLSAFLRFYKLNQIPNGLYVDEAAIGYNAHSILRTGKDEYGKTLPIFLRSFGAFSSPMYVYLTTIPILFFGLSVFSVRFISALSGVLIVYISYLLLVKSSFFKSDKYPLLATFLLAINPWNVFFSRAAYEANLALLLILVASYFLLLYFQRLKISSENKNTSQPTLLFALVVLSFSTYAYQATRLIAYLILGGVLIYGLRIEKLQFVKRNILGLMLFLVIQIPQLVLLATPAFKFRATGLFYLDVIISQAKKLESVFPILIAEPLAFIREFGAQAVAYFSPKNLFWLGDPDLQRSIPGIGVFYSWMVVPYLVGSAYVLSKVREFKYLLLVIASLIFVIPAALTKDPFSTLRSLPLSITLTVIISLGIKNIIENKFRKLWYLLGLILILLSLISLWRTYFILFPHERATNWGYGYSQLVDKITSSPDVQYLIDETRMKPGYVQYLFFSGYEPSEFQSRFSKGMKDNYYNDLNFDLGYKIENVRFGKINWEKDIYNQQIIVGDALSVSREQIEEHRLKQVFEIKDPLKNIVFIAYETNPQAKCRSINNDNENCK